LDIPFLKPIRPPLAFFSVSFSLSFSFSASNLFLTALLIKAPVAAGMPTSAIGRSVNFPVSFAFSVLSLILFK
jgi:hypothetical protein